MSDRTMPSEEDLRAYLETLREAQTVEVVVQSFGILATAAEVKLGRQDARPLIDGMTALVDATADHMPEQMVQRMRDTVAQLKLAQVQAERDLAAQQQSASGQESATTAQEQPSATGQQQESPASKLWIPGRD